MKSARLFLLALGILFFGSKAFSQGVKLYEKEWKRVDDLLQQRALSQSALQEVWKIYHLAKKEGQEAQVIKALVYITNLQQENREAAETLAIQQVEKEIRSSKEPAAAILKSYLADVYWQYLQRNRWKLYNRTNTMGFNKDDLATWTLEYFHYKISELYLQSLQPETTLKNTKLNRYEAIITKGNTRHLRPTLYDLLAQRALDYFKSGEYDIKKPAYAFEITQPEAFAPAAQFARATFTTKDTLSLQHKALLIYQKLIQLHLTDAKPDALVDVDIDRMAYVYQHAVMENKDSLYMQALQQLATQYNRQPAAAQAQFLLAAFYEQQAAQYHPLQDTTFRYERVKAKTLLEQVVKDSAVKSEGWVNSYNLLKNINQKIFSFEVEKVNVPGQPFRSLVKYRNLQNLHFRLLKPTAQLKDLFKNPYDEKFWNALLSIAPVKNWQQTLPSTYDLQEHAVEIKIEALPAGEYILLASPDAAFDKKNSPLGAQLFYVSNISFIGQGAQFFVLHRESGQPLANAAVTVYTQQYNYKTSQYNKVKTADYKSDRNGYFRLQQKQSPQNNQYFFSIAHQGDSLNIEENRLGYYYYDPEQEGVKEKSLNNIFFFTDRAIYRPDQTVYFKGIVVHQKKKDNSLVTGYKTTVFLRDANGETVDSLGVTSNEWGSFSGSFHLPQGVLNGEFRIQDRREENAVTFSVEEYKRPRFYVELDKIKESYRVGDSIQVTGSAKAYAGNVVNGATITYRVVRQPRFIYPWLLKGGWWPRVQPMEVAHGATVTQADGQFAFSFKAIPDLKIDRKLAPLYDYRIETTVTDINRETRSHEQIVTAGYQSLLLKVNLPERLPVDSFKNLYIRTENLNGEYQPSTVKVTITQLLPEQRLIRPRYWQQPDQFVMNKQEYVSLFPHDEYGNESDYRNWPKDTIVATQIDSTRMSGQWKLPQKNVPQGFYAIEMVTTDKAGTEVKDVKFIELFDAKSKTLLSPDYLWANGSEKAIEPGDNINIQLGSSAPDVFVIQQVDKLSDSTNQFSFIKLDQQKKVMSFPASEKDRGGYGVTFFFVKHNRIFQLTQIINVPWSNKELVIETGTFRDKTLPGSQETWSVKISGYKGDQAAAEMLAGMYDASLDQFKLHNWSKPGIWPVYARTFDWSGRQNFTAVPSYQKWVEDGDYRSFEKTYDQFNFYRNRGMMVRMRSAAAPQMAERAAVATDSAADGMLQGKAAGVQVQNQQLEEAVVTGYNVQQQPATAPLENIQVRRNLAETAFFFPHLTTDKEGNISFTFTTPEALTRWKLQTLAHTKDLAMGLLQKELVTQKELMVQPNAPRFLRQGDRMEFSAKIVNLSDTEMTGQAQLELVDASTGQSVDGWFQNVFPNQYFTVAAGQSEVVRFPIEVPFLFNQALTWRVVAKAGSKSDGEEAIIPVLTNKVLVTETLPLPMRGTGTKNFTFEKLLNANSETLQHQALTVEYTTNPAWLAVQALPYLMENPAENVEQTWNRYYANSLAAKLVKTSPKLLEIFETWKTKDTAALLSALQKNEELKSVLLQETPWVLQAKTETQQKKNIALLFDLVRMGYELKSSMEKLKSMQSENGGFVWFQGGPDDRYFTQYILTGIGHLKQLKGIAEGQQEELDAIVKKALPYLDKKIKADYDLLLKNKVDLKKQNIGYIQTQYLYLRSFFRDQPVAPIAQTAYNYYRKQVQQYWKTQNKYMQGMTALALHRTADLQTPRDILRSLKESAVVSEEMGMYWKNNTFGVSPFWWHAPIETQSLLIEAFSEIGQETTTVEALKTWLLKNKQTTNWRTTKATADACYALLLQGANWFSSEPAVHIKLGSTTLSHTEQNAEAGTGYFKHSVTGAFVKPEMGNITVAVQQPSSPSTNQPSWGAVYWQYFEEIDNVSTAETPLQLSKKLFIEKGSDRGPVLTPVNEGDALNVGDKIKVRIELKVDRDMEYVHMKDVRAAALEPVNVLSGYKWQGGLSYYETTRDASTSFFFTQLRKGTYVFEYPLFVTHTGNYSNGLTTIESLYAPEFKAHSEGIRITIE